MYYHLSAQVTQTGLTILENMGTMVSFRTWLILPSTSGIIRTSSSFLTNQEQLQELEVKE